MTMFIFCTIKFLILTITSLTYILLFSSTENIKYRHHLNDHHYVNLNKLFENPELKRLIGILHNIHFQKYFRLQLLNTFFLKYCNS